MRRYEGRMISTVTFSATCFLEKFLPRILLVLALAPLAGCAGGNSSADLAPAAPQQVEAPPPEPPPSAPAKRSKSRNAKAAPAAAPEPAAPAPASSQVTGPVVRTPERIKTECWMKYEADKKINIDQRLALVEKCVAESSSNQPPQRN